VVIDEVVDQGRIVCVRARTVTAAVACPECRQPAQRVHAYHLRRLADIPVAGRGVVVELRVRRLVCQTRACARRTFREQVPEIAQRWARRTRQLTALIADIGVVVAGRAGAAVLSRLGVCASRSTVLRVLMTLPAPSVPVPAVLSVDDFALRRGHRHHQQGLTADIQAPPSSPQLCPSVAQRVGEHGQRSGGHGHPQGGGQHEKLPVRRGDLVIHPYTRRFTHPWWCYAGHLRTRSTDRRRIIVSPIGSAEAFMKLATALLH
jgi:hypothetical protein